LKHDHQLEPNLAAQAEERHVLTTTTGAEISVGISADLGRYIHINNADGSVPLNEKEVAWLGDVFANLGRHDLRAAMFRGGKSR
jgi:hypothetical protein